MGLNAQTGANRPHQELYGRYAPKQLGVLPQITHISYDVLRDKADVLLMYVHRLRVMMTEMYKISNDLQPKYIHDLFTVKTSKHYLRN